MAPILLWNRILFREKTIMLIESSARSTTSLSRPTTATGNRFNSATEFSSSVPKAEETTAKTQSGKAKATTEELLAKLNEYIEKGPIVAMREKILESMGISEEELKSLPPEKQDAIEAEIAEKIKEMLLRQQETQKTAQTQDMTAAKAGVYAAVNAL